MRRKSLLLLMACLFLISISASYANGISDENYNEIQNNEIINNTIQNNDIHSEKDNNTKSAKSKELINDSVGNDGEVIDDSVEVTGSYQERNNLVLSSEVIDNVTLSSEVIDNVTLSSEVIDNVTLSSEVIDNVTLSSEVIDNVTLSSGITQEPTTLEDNNETKLNGETATISTNQNTNSTNSSTTVKANTIPNTVNKPKKLSQSSILKASKLLHNYISKNKKLPNYVTINNYKFSIPEFMYLLSKTIISKYNKVKSDITIKYDIKNPSKPSGSNIKGKLSSKQHYSSAKNIVKFINKYNKVPNYINTKLGRVQYQTAIYGLNKVLAWSYNHKSKLPTALSLNVKKTNNLNKFIPKYTRPKTSNLITTNPPAASGSIKFLTMNEVLEASTRVKNYVEKNGVMPNTVSIGGNSYKINDFLYLMSKAIVNKNEGKTSSIPLLTTKSPANPSGNNKLGTIQKTEYLSLAKSLVLYYETNKQAPNYLSTSLGNLQYQSTVYIFSKIASYIYTNKVMPNNVNVNVTSSSKINGGQGSTTSGTSSSALAAYLKATKNCQVNNAAIKSLSATLTKNSQTELQKATAIYNWVQKNIKYSFYYNTRNGAAKTLSSKSGNCVDQSHLLIALFRASGLAARYVNGQATFTSSGTIGHTWAEVYVNGKWVIADTTSSYNKLGSVTNWKNPKVYGRYAEITF
ncbi:pseudomurein-binding repeat protein [Methanobrevibacter cuticularis]|uniref:Pseudomurein-binding repeat protein n=1 Tax=Methanobrevibacter cuticularis TaxID=47311 RepID=A0A166CW77_9EURY|nr:transglutaminase domain-containing protein [Methanobrevibacter cuticularis]KZX14929.1 pseudomurein-binding repeat protein [Methanobrevibacter cuticularis]